MKRSFLLINFVFFQLTWFICVLGGDEWLILALGLLVCHFLLSSRKRSDLVVMTLIGIIGICVDFVLTLIGIFQFSEVLFPLWLVVLWAMFALTFNHSMAWIKRRPLYQQSVLGALGGASSYYAGMRLGAVDFGFDVVITMLVLLLLWGLLVPLNVFVLARLKGWSERGAW